MEPARKNYKDTFLTERQVEILKKIKQYGIKETAKLEGMEEAAIYRRRTKAYEVVAKALRTVKAAYELGLIDDEEMIDLMKTTIKRE